MSLRMNASVLPPSSRRGIAARGLATTELVNTDAAALHALRVALAQRARDMSMVDLSNAGTCTLADMIHGKHPAHQ